MDAKHKNKVLPTWRGPARVIERVSDLVFKVKDIGSDREQELHARHLKRYADKDLVITDQLRTIAAHGGRGFVVDSILDHKLEDGIWMLLVQWDISWDTTSWEPLLRLNEDVPTKVTGYLRLLQDPSQRKLLQDALDRASNSRSRRSRK